MRSNAPGLCVLGSAVLLFGALTAIAWHQDSELDIPLGPPTSEHICDRLNHELAEQVKAHMISRRHRYDAIQRCWNYHK